MNPFLSFIRKEFLHIFRDKRTMLILLAMPVLLIILFGYAITTEIRRVPVAVWDQSRDESTRKMIHRIDAGEYFDLYAMVGNEKEGQSLLRQGKVKLIVVFPPGFASSPDAPVQLLTDATDPNEAVQLSAYASAAMAGTDIQARQPAAPVIRLLYNPQMKGAYNFVPGVMGLILILVCAMMTSVGIVKEKETGTMEILLVSPLKPVYIILAKATPYLLLSLVNIATILFLSYFLLGVPIKGSLPLLVFVSVLYALVSLSLGLLISTVTRTQQAAMLVCAVLLMLPVVLLSGMVFPIENMPAVLRMIANAVPAKWYIIAVKDIMIKGLGIRDVLPETGILAGMAFLLVLLSVRRFRIRLQ